MSTHAESLAVRRVVVLAFALLLSFLAGCATLIPQRAAERTSRTESCAWAAKNGQCRPGCGWRQPACNSPKLLGCSDIMCMFQNPDGSLVFAGYVKGN